MVLGQYVEMARNEDYWDKARVPKVDKLVLYPMPEATTRVAALRSGQVDWIEVPAPDAIPSIKAAGFNVVLWPYPHTYPYVLNVTEGSPFHDVRVRQAINYSLDREGICKLINDTAKPAVGLYPPGHPFFGNPTQHYTYDPAKAKALLAEAGYGPDKPLKTKIMISTSGSGQMLPIPMNEFMQQNFKAVGMDVDFDVVEWGTMLVARAQRYQVPAVAWRGRDQYQPQFGRSLHHVSLLRVGHVCSQRLQLGSFQHAGIRRVAAQGSGDLRRSGANQTARRRAQHRGGPGGVAVHRARPQPPGDVEEGHRVHSGAELVCRSDDCLDGVVPGA